MTCLKNFHRFSRQVKNIQHPIVSVAVPIDSRKVACQGFPYFHRIPGKIFSHPVINLLPVWLLYLLQIVKCSLAPYDFKAQDIS